MRVQLVDGEYRVVLPAEAMEALKRKDGGEVQVLPLELPVASDHRFANFDEGMDAFRRTLPRHANADRELAK